MAADPGTTLAADELDAFLELGLTARLACVDDRDWPYIVPIWHQWDGSRFWIIGSEHAKWISYLQRSPQVALSIDQPESVSRVLCQGMAKYAEGPTLDGQWVEIAHRMVSRYLGADAIPGYSRETRGMRRWLFSIDVDKLVSWRGSGLTN